MKSALIAIAAAFAMGAGAGPVEAAVLTYDLSGSLTSFSGSPGTPIEVIETIDLSQDTIVTQPNGSVQIRGAFVNGVAASIGSVEVEINHVPQLTLSGSALSNFDYNEPNDRLSSNFGDKDGNSVGYSLVVPSSFNPLVPQTLAISSSTGIFFDKGVGQDFATNTLTISDVSAVPLPASLPLLGSALLGLGVVGYGLKRRRRHVAPGLAEVAP